MMGKITEVLSRAILPGPIKGEIPFMFQWQQSLKSTTSGSPVTPHVSEAVRAGFFRTPVDVTMICVASIGFLWMTWKVFTDACEIKPRVTLNRRR